jgi:hypothetical protein
MIDFPISLHPDWMGNMCASLPDAALADLVIPGSHDAASYSIDTFKLFSAVGRTQNVSVQEQLHRGVRFLDIRVAGSGREAVSIWHGCLQGAPLQRVLEDILLFCQDFPGEFLIIELVAEYGRDFKPAQKKKALDLVKETLGDKLFTEDSRDKLLKTPIKQLTANGKQVCVLVHNRMYEGFTYNGAEYSESKISKEYGFFDSGKWMKSKWQ